MFEDAAPDDQWADAPRCTACGRNLYADELGGFGCRLCVERCDQLLGELAGPGGLYSRLSGALMPGAGSEDGRVTGSRTAPLPLRIEPLSLMARGGVVTILQTWLIDWHEVLGWGFPRWEGDLQRQLDQVVGRLRGNLPWAASSHPAFDEFAGEVRQITGACRAQVTGERPERRITLTCPCGAALRVTLSTDGRRCTGCGAQYGWAELRDLPLAERTAA